MQTRTELYGVSKSPESMVFVTGGSGHGSTNSKIRRFTTLVESIGGDIIYIDSAVEGAVFKIMSDGVYAISYTDRVSAGVNYFGISKDSTQLTTSIQSIENKNRLKAAITAGNETDCNTTSFFRAGSTIRFHTDGGIDGSTDIQVTARITKIS
jgi:hypothetical protein